MMRCTISQLLIFCITPFAFNALSCSSPYYGTSIDTDIISTEEPHDARTVSFAYNTICTIEHDFIGGFASTNPPCPLHKLRNRMDQGKTSSLTVLQQLIYEILAATVTHVISPIVATTLRQHPPRNIKKLFPGMNRSKWNKMTLAFSKNAYLRDIFYGYHRKVNISDFVEMVICTLKVEVVFSVTYFITFVRYTLVLVVLWMHYAIALARYHLTLLKFKILLKLACVHMRLQYMWLQLRPYLQALFIVLCYPFTIHASFDQIALCYMEMVFQALGLFMRRLMQRMAVSWQLFILLARNHSISFALRVVLGIRVSTSKYKRIRSNRPRRPSSWKLFVLTFMSYLRLVAAPCSDSSISVALVLVIVMDWH